ncbi:MAG: OmpA family protein [Stappiaceae bacterium]
MALSACQSVEEVATPNVTNAPASGYSSLKTGSEEDFILNVGRRIYFTAGSSTLDSTAKVTLDSQAAWLNKNPSWKVKLQGFSDDPGDAAANLALSQKRADAAMNYIISKGVASDRLWAKGYGKERIVRDCPDISCKSQNRRVIANLRESVEEWARR